MAKILLVKTMKGSGVMAKIAGIERRQMLVEGDTRAALAFLLGLWMPQLHALRQHVKGLTRWAVDVDPHGI